MIRMLTLIAFVALTACEQTTLAVDNAARRSAKVAVDEALVTRFPAIPPRAITPFSDCVIDNANAREIGQLARDAVTGVTDTTVALIRTVIERSETQTCIIRAGTASLSS